MNKFIWIFNGVNSHFPSGVFEDFNKADEWIKANFLSGILTKYPLNKGVYEWAIENDLFIVKKEEHLSPAFIGKFSTASQEHFHYEQGLKE